MIAFGGKSDSGALKKKEPSTPLFFDLDLLAAASFGILGDCNESTRRVKDATKKATRMTMRGVLMMLMKPAQPLSPSLQLPSCC